MRIFRNIRYKKKLSEKSFQKSAKRNDPDYISVSERDIDKMRIKGYIVNDRDDIQPGVSRSWKDNVKRKHKFGKDKKTIRK